MTTRLHDDEFDISITLVRNLVDEQFPEYRALELEPMKASGSTNLQFRLGHELLVRLPRQPHGGKSIQKEKRWTQIMGAGLPVAVPEILHVGEPAQGFSEHWSIIRWLEGEHPKNFMDADSEDDEITLAQQLADTILALRALPVDPDPKLRKPYRGQPLAKYHVPIREQIEKCREINGLDLDIDAALSFWDEAKTLEGADSGPDQLMWFHSDLVSENLLVQNGELSSVLDFGGLGVGDPTADLHGAWELFGKPAREEFRKRIGADDATWKRGRAWALGLAMATFPYYWGKMPGRVRDRYVMAQAALEDFKAGG